MTHTPTRNRRRMPVTMAATLIVLGPSTGCGVPGADAIAASRATTTAQPVASTSHISEATWTDGRWPFTVAEGDLGCTTQGGMQIQTFTAGGVTYSLNLAAKGTGTYPPVDAVSRADPNVPHTKIDIAEVLDKARSLCIGVELLTPTDRGAETGTVWFRTNALRDQPRWYSPRSRPGRGCAPPARFLGLQRRCHRLPQQVDALD